MGKETVNRPLNSLLNPIARHPLFWHFGGYLLLMMVAMQNVWAVDITAQVDRNPVNFNSSFMLVFSATDSPDGDPDFTPLKKDFDIINQQKNIQSSFVNGRFQTRTQWSLKLFAKRTGKLLIPEIPFGNDLSFPTTVNVIAKTNVANHTEDIFLEILATPETPYIQSQVIFTVRLFHRVQLARGSHLSDPQAADTVIEKLGEDRNFETNLKGVRFSVIERKYAIYPQKSGEITIPPLVLNAQVASARSSGMNGFFNPQITSSKRVSSRAWTMQVKPVPDEFKADHWLPAEHLYIEEKWSNKDLTVNVGEPITRTISMLAKGVAASQLPDIAASQTNLDIKSYPDQPVLKEKNEVDGLIALREEKIAYIPSAAGEIILPAIKVSWFNTQTHQIEVASLPPVKLQALGSPTADVPVASELQTPELHAPVKSMDNSAPQPSGISRHPAWMWLSLILCLCWLSTLIFFLTKRGVKEPVSEETESSENINFFSLNRLKYACQNNNPHQVQQALIAWGQHHFNAHNLTSIARYCDEPLAEQIQRLQQALYSEKDSQWDAAQLFNTFKNFKPEQEKLNADNEPLEPLFKL